MFLCMEHAILYKHEQSAEEPHQTETRVAEHTHWQIEDDVQMAAARYAREGNMHPSSPLAMCCAGKCLMLNPW